MRGPNLSRSGQRLVLVVAVLALYGALLVALHGLTFPMDRDELHFWPTSLLFSHRWIPSLALLRSYNELNTPLPFILFGALEHLFHGGIVVARAFDFTLSLAMVLWVGLADERGDWSGARAALGMLLFPYFLGVATHLYTDIIAAACGMFGLVLHQRRHHAAAAVAFILAIASRQYLLAFPAALVLLNGADAWQRRNDGWRVWAVPALWMPVVACASIFAWMALFGGLAPSGAVRLQHLATAHMLTVFPAHALYFLTCVGAYFVVPEWVLFPRPLHPRHLFQLPWLAAALVLLVLFAVFPPLHNVVIVPTMGFLDRFVRLFAPDLLRVALFYGLALLAVVRLARWNLAGVLLLTNAAVMLKAHIAWDKYALPMLVILWLLRAADQLSAPASPAAER